MTLLELKKQGKAPEWMNEESLHTLQKGYLLPDETPYDMYKRIAKAADKGLGYPGLSGQFFDLMWNNWLCPSTPVASNMGTERGLPISCYGSFVEDSVDGIFNFYHEAAMLTKNGGGIGSYWSSVRGRGASIKGNGQSEGVVPWLAILDRTALAVGQGGVRRAGIQATLDIEHGDFEEFLQIRKPLGDVNRQCLNLHQAINVSDDFMKSLTDGNEVNRNKWIELLKMRSETGEPYIMFSDTANRTAPKQFQGKKIYGTQLCITGDQRVVSSLGYLTAKELYEIGEPLILFNGKVPVEASPMKLRRKSEPVVEIILDNGMSHTVTLDHGIPTYNKSNRTTIRKAAKDVRVGDQVIVQTKKGLFGDLDMQDEAYLLGLYQGDGTQYKDYKYIDIWEKDFDLLGPVKEVFDRVFYKYAPEKYTIVNQYGDKIYRKYEPSVFTEQQTGDSSVRKKRLGSKVLSLIPDFRKGHVPDWIWKSNEKTQWSYIKGLLETDGTVYVSNSKGNPIQLNLASVDKEWLRSLQLIFNNLGLCSSIRLLRKGGKGLFPNHKGSMSEYDTKDCFRLIVGNKPGAFEIEKHTGFLTRKGIKLDIRHYKDNIKKCYRVVEIKDAGVSDVYCPTVYNDEHIFVANGMLTFNCSEIFLPNDKDHTYVCCLSSMNLSRYEEWTNWKCLKTGLTAIELSIYFLDGVMQEFIDKAKNLPGFEKAVRFSEKSRALGLGVLGYHSLLQDKGFAFDSFDSMMLNAKIFKQLEVESESATTKLATLLGEPEWVKGFNRRNLTCLAIAPTMSNSIISGGMSAGIEPISSNCYSLKSAKGTFIRKNPLLVKKLEEVGQNTVDVWDLIIKSGGSVQGLSDKILSPEDKQVFKTAREINQFAIVKQAGQRQKWIDQGQSVNLFFTSDSSAKYIHDVHMMAWEEGLKSLYYLRSESVLRGHKSIEYQKSDCASCEG